VKKIGELCYKYVTEVRGILLRTQIILNIKKPSLPSLRGLHTWLDISIREMFVHCIETM
jgi:hypothetical protein